MSEVMICRGCSSGDDSKRYKKFKRIIFENSVNWVVPDNIVDNEVYVRLVGGCGRYEYKYDGKDHACEGGSGFLNNSKIELVPGKIININIANNWGESSSFGSYLIANGGSRADGAVGGFRYAGWKDRKVSFIGKSYQFGGSFGGGDAGVWGGGGGACHHNDPLFYKKGGGNGGKYGGGGSGDQYYDFKKSEWIWSPIGLGGTYGGNGGNRNCDAENGINTIGWTNVDRDIVTGEYITGPGLAGDPNYSHAGGGGFGGCAGWFSGGGYGSNADFGNSINDQYYCAGAGYGKGSCGGKYGSGGGYFTSGRWGGQDRLASPEWEIGAGGVTWGSYGSGVNGVCVIEFLYWTDYFPYENRYYDKSKYDPHFDDSNKYPILY